MIAAAIITVYEIAKAMYDLLDAAFKPILQALGFDPNDVVGPTGIGTQKWVKPTDTLAYTVNFENYSTAQLPVQHVRVNTQLDVDLDWSTFQFGTVTVAGTPISVSGTADHVSGAGTIPNFGGTLVSVDGTIDRTTGRVTWTIAGPPQLDDPYQPTPFGDFLPPNVTSPQGEGAIQYSIKPRSDSPQGRTLEALADITFDEHASGGTTSTTNTWVNTIDRTAPTATVTALPATSSPTFTVAWSGTDPGAGIKDYTVRVKVDSGSWTNWVANSTLTSKSYTGAAGHTYAFCATARDLLLQAEPTCSTAETTTTT